MAEIVLNATVLVLNRSYLPIHVTSARRAFALVYRDVARVGNVEYETFDFGSWGRGGGAEGEVEEWWVPIGGKVAPGSGAARHDAATEHPARQGQ